MKCSAKTAQGTPCKFNATRHIAGKAYCGIHASAAGAWEPIRSLGTHKTAEPLSEQEQAGAEIIRQVRALIEARVADSTIGVVLLEWKAGRLK